MRSANGLHDDRCLATAVKVSKVADTIKHLFHQNTSQLLWPAFTSFVLPMLRYGTQVWSPHLAKDIKTIERVQRRFTRSFRSLKELDCKFRLLDLKTLSLQKYFTFTEMVFIFKALHGKINCEPKDLGIMMSHIPAHVVGSVASWSNAGHPLSLQL